MTPYMKSLIVIPGPAVALLLVALVVLTGCGDESEVAEEREVVPNVTPVALDDLPEGVEVVDLLIEDGELQTEEIVLQEDEPTVLRVSNGDDQRYALRIGDLLTATQLPAGEVTTVELTTPLPQEYVGELLTEEDEEVVDTVPVLVIAPGRTGP